MFRFTGNPQSLILVIFTGKWLLFGRKFGVSSGNVS